MAAGPESMEITVQTRYLDEQSDPQAQRFAFAYTISISNNGDEAVTLRNRHWQITDDNNSVEEVSGEGVVGQQPTIKPGATFEYTSGAVIETEFGNMTGRYEMERSDGSRFWTAVPPFLLALPHAVH
jgi:ApaG protein